MNDPRKTVTASEIIYEKTAKGAEEIQTRKFKLPQKLRTALIVVDGKKNRQVILNQFGDVGTVLDELEQQGFIVGKIAATGVAALSPEELQKRVEMGKNFMANTVQDALGMTPPALSFNDSVKHCRSLEELQEKLEPYAELITSSKGKKTADAYRDEMHNLLFPK
jgi:hypothetical protein